MRRAALALCLLGACSGTEPNAGLDALVRVAGAQYFSGAMPAAADGPMVTTVESLNNTVRAGQLAKKISGRVKLPGNAVAIGFQGDVGYWIVRTGAVDILNPGEVTFAATLSFSPELAPGQHDLVVRAVSADGHFGPPNDLALTVDPPVASMLAITLDWDSEADLDLHVVQPDGITIWAHNSNSYEQPRPGEPFDPAAVTAGGILDFDSNAGCLIDGRRRERVVWTEAPPKGHYLVRVDVPSLCGQPGAHWRVSATLGGNDVGHASGNAGDADTRTTHDESAGVLALELDVP